MTDDSSRDDPVLVRPYITTEPGGGPAGREVVTGPAPTWPAGADLPEEGTREMPAVQRVPPVPDPKATGTVLRRQRLLVLAVVAGLAVAGGAGFLLLRPDDAEPPATARPAPVSPDVTAAPAAAPVASAGRRSTSPGPRSASAVPTVTSTGPAAGGPATATSAPAAGEPAPTTPPGPPGTARTGAITAAGGRCLVLGGLLGLDGSPVQTASCSGLSAQRWTLETDGTLRVAGKCAQAGPAVRVRGCDDGDAGQWRAGPDGSLVNPATGGCLTDPGAVLTTVATATCTGAADQRWTLP